jgi:hypothetical protein
MRTEEDGDSLAAAPLNITHVEVDVDGLDDFRTLLSRELDANLRPGADGVQHDYALGVGFGARNPGDGVQAAAGKYRDCLQGSMANLAAYIDAAEILVDAIGRVSTKYRDTDAASARINEELAAAFHDAQEARIVALKLEEQRQRDAQRFGRGILE